MTHDLGVCPFDEANVSLECKIEFCGSVICGSVWRFCWSGRAKEEVDFAILG